ncbi:MAG: hypothetical protein ABEK59_07150 [Halobacteria archaeon]
MAEHYINIPDKQFSGLAEKGEIVGRTILEGRHDVRQGDRVVLHSNGGKLPVRVRWKKFKFLVSGDEELELKEHDRNGIAPPPVKDTMLCFEVIDDD